MNYIVLAVLLCICCFFAVRSKTLEDEQRILNSAVALSIAASPLAWKHNYLLLMPGFVHLLQRKQLLAAGLAFIGMEFIPSILHSVSSEWTDRSYSTLLGALVIFFSLLVRRSGV